MYDSLGFNVQETSGGGAPCAGRLHSRRPKNGSPPVTEPVWKAPRRLRDCHNVLDLGELARRRLPSPIFHYLDGGAESETTLRNNTAAFDQERLLPRYACTGDPKD